MYKILTKRSCGGRGIIFSKQSYYMIHANLRLETSLSSLNLKQGCSASYCCFRRPAMLCLTPPLATPGTGERTTIKRRNAGLVRASVDKFPSFLPKEVEDIKDPFARKLASRIERIPVQVRKMSTQTNPMSHSLNSMEIMSSCVKPRTLSDRNPLVLLHGFDSSCLEWRYTYPLLEDAGLETWAVDILGWGFSDLEKLPSCDVVSKREHLYQLWVSYIKRPVVLVGPSLGAAVAIDFAVNHPEAVDRLILIDASVYAEDPGKMSTLPRAIPYAGVFILKSIPLRFYANFLCFKGISFARSSDWTNIGRLHCLFPWWEDATVSFMISGGYNVKAQIKEVEQRTLVIWGEDDQIISSKLAVLLQSEHPNAILRQIPECGHLPHVEKPESVAKLISEFVQEESKQEANYVCQS